MHVNGEPINELDDEVTVTLELDDDTEVTCTVVTLLSIDNKRYIVLMPLEENGDANKDGEVWFYHYSEDENDPLKDPGLHYIDDDAEYERVADAFDEYLDSIEFDEHDCPECSECSDG